MKCNDPARQLSAGDIDNLEERIGIELTRPLREHYLRCNGGWPDPNAFFNGGDYYFIQQFLSIDDNDRDVDLEKTYSILKVVNTFPRTFIPFAVDAGGDYFLCDCASPNGRVLIFESEFYDNPDRAFTLLADSFDDFLNDLVDFQDE